jgi:hypothetical protein
MEKKIIEIIGPPGVGKSSIYKSLCQDWNAKKNWIYQDALLAPKKPSFVTFTRWLEYKTQVLLGKKLAKALPVENGLRFVGNHEQLGAFCWHHLSNPTFFTDQESGKRFRAAYFLFLDFCRYQAIQDKSYDGPCLIDEGFLQKSFLIHDDQQVMKDLIPQYLSLIPLPYAVIYIDTPDKHIIKERLHNRRKGGHSSVARNEDVLVAETARWQDLLQMVLDTIGEKVTVYKIDGAKPIRENVAVINNFLTNIR